MRAQRVSEYAPAAPGTGLGTVVLEPPAQAVRVTDTAIRNDYNAPVVRLFAGENDNKVRENAPPSSEVAQALRALQGSLDRIHDWASLIRAGQMNAQQAGEALEQIERQARVQQQALARLVEAAEPTPESAAIVAPLPFHSPRAAKRAAGLL